MASVLKLDEHASYTSHALHGEDRSWPETNCYVDLWIELLHAQRLEPCAALPMTLGLDFEGDQYTFFKFSLGDLRTLYGVEVQELAIWRPLAAQLMDQAQAGRLALVEVDSFFLPDTAGVAYHLAHEKTTIGVDSIDLARRRLDYFHNRGYFTLEGDDFDGLFRLGAHAASEAALAPYVEIVKLERLVRRPVRDLAEQSLMLARGYLRNRPAVNPVALHRSRLVDDLAWLKQEPLATFHKYAFATVRQVGACFGLAASYARWIESVNGLELARSADAFDAIAQSAKTIQYKLARLASTKRDVDIGPLFDAMSHAWDDGMAHFAAKLDA